MPRQIATLLLLVLAGTSHAFMAHPSLLGSLTPRQSNTLRPSGPTTSLRRIVRSAVASGKLSMVAGVPEVGAVVAASFLPATLGLWRSEYTVSYGYGAAMFFCGLLFFLSGPSPLGKAHALVLALYGFRLNAFLLYRELKIDRFKKFVEKIEDKANSRGGRLSRLPFILGCGFLYFCMAAPLFVTAQAEALPIAVTFIALAYEGFYVAAWGDLIKTRVKAKEGEDALVVSGPFALVRHPNYSGEMLLWTSSLMAAFLLSYVTGTLAANAVWLAFSVLGAIGINFVLVQATTGLEKRQKEKYGDPSHPEYEKYKKWVSISWKGITFPAKEKKGEVEEAASGDAEAKKEENK